MTRKIADCPEMPSDIGCTLTLTGEEEEVLSAAAAAFLSPKTIEYHLRHVYMKLGIRSRAEPAGGLAARP
jgi:DNA-binding NarL/FixJ family response regulator